MFHKTTMDENNIYNLDKTQIRMLRKHYTQQAYQSENESWLNELILSPQSYRRKVKNKKCLGCCCDCKGAITNAKKSNTLNKKLPKYAIANGLYLGKAPPVIEDLNPVELAMISPVRVLKRMFCFHAGAHKSIKGFHTMVMNNDVSYTYRVSNYFVDKQKEINDTIESSGSTFEELQHMSYTYKIETEDLGEQHEIIDTIYFNPNEPIDIKVSDVQKACTQDVWYKDRTIYIFCVQLNRININMHCKLYDPWFLELLDDRRNELINVYNYKLHIIFW